MSWGDRWGGGCIFGLRLRTGRANVSAGGDVDYGLREVNGEGPTCCHLGAPVSGAMHQVSLRPFQLRRDGELDTSHITHTYTRYYAVTQTTKQRSNKQNECRIITHLHVKITTATTTTSTRPSLKRRTNMAAR